MPDDQANTYKQARTLLEDAPRRAFDLAVELAPLEPVDDRRLQLLAEAGQRSGRVDEAIARLDELATKAERDLDRLNAAVERGELLLLQGRLGEAGEALERARTAAEGLDDASTSEARHLTALLWRLEHDLAVAEEEVKRAEKAARRLLTEYAAEDAANPDGLVVSPDELDASQRVERARALYDGWAYSAARELFEDLLDDGHYEQRSRWHLAQLALNKLRDRPKEAERLFEELAKGGYRTERSMYQTARAQMRQERYDDALATLDAYYERFPSGRYVESVYYYRGWLPYDHDQNEEAIRGFERYIARYGKGAGRSSYVYGFLAWTQMRLNRWDDAIETYEQMRSFGNMLVWGKALYWQAYAFNEKGEVDEAIARLDELRETYPVTYYGVLGEQLRARINGGDPRASKVWWPDGGGKLDDTPEPGVEDFKLDALNSEQEAIWRRTRALVELGEHHLARQTVEPIYDDLLDAVPNEDREAWIHAIGHYIEDFHEMWDVATGGTIAAMPRPPRSDSREAAMAYPRAYRDVVEEVADEFDLPPELIWSIMRQESRYRPAQISYTDAVGALQMIPRTARKVARDLGVTYNPRTFPLPEVGFRYSGYYMRKLLDTFDGLFVMMAAAYNSGPHVVARWLENNPETSFAWLVEEFPYNEGRNYCRKVAEHFVRYLYLYEDDDKRRGEILDRLFPLSRDVDVPEDVGY